MIIYRYHYGDSSPFFALVGVGLASGNGLLTKDDELEGVCYEIRVSIYYVYVPLERLRRSCHRLRPFPLSHCF